MMVSICGEGVRMRGADHQQSGMFSYLSAERRVPRDHPLRAIRAMVDEALRNMGPQFEGMYAKVGRPSIAPEKLLRALLLQVLYTVRSERMLMEQLNYNLLFRWFVGLNLDDPVWNVTVFTKNRERLLGAEVANPKARIIRTCSEYNALGQRLFLYPLLILKEGEGEVTRYGPRHRFRLRPLTLRETTAQNYSRFEANSWHLSFGYIVGSISVGSKITMADTTDS